MSDDAKVWYGVKQTATSGAVVTCSIVVGNLSSKRSVKALGNVGAAAKEARAGAERALAELQEAVEERER